MPFKDKEKAKKYHREYNKKYRIEYRKTTKWKKWHKKYVAGEVAITYRKKYNKTKSEQYRKERLERRNKTYDAMGGKCAECGFSDYRALQIDHVNGDGNKERILANRKNYYANVLVSFLKKETRYQLLCANCNWIKRHENREYRKRV